MIILARCVKVTSGSNETAIERAAYSSPIDCCGLAEVVGCIVVLEENRLYIQLAHADLDYLTLRPSIQVRLSRVRECE